MLTTILWQSSRWRLDIFSLLLGLILGIVLAVGLTMLWPRILVLWQTVRNRYESTRSQLLAGGQDRFRDELLSYLDSYHLDRDKAALSRIVVRPHIATPFRDSLDERPPSSLNDFGRLWPELGQLIARPPQATISAGQLLKGKRRVAITGLPGAGKSSYLALLAYQYVTAEPAEEKEAGQEDDTLLAGQLPAFVHVAELDLAVEPAEAVLLEALSRRATTLLRPRLAGIWRENLAAGTITLFLDGLDELTASQRLPYLNWLGTLCKQQPTMSAIVAAPAYGYGPMMGLDFAMVETLPWQIGQAQQLWETWQTTTEALLAPLAAFWRFGQTPFVTRLRLLLGVEEADQPERLVDLLEAALRYLLPAANVEPAWLAPVTRELWEKIAWGQLNSAGGSIGRPELEALIAEVLLEYKVEDKGGTGRLLNYLDSHNLFHSWSNGHISLRSSLWRDYLAASYLAQLGDSSAIQAQLENRDWQEVRRFYVARQGADLLIQEILNPEDRSRRQPGLFEAAYWLAELPEDLSWQNDVLGRLGRLAVQADAPTALRQRAVVAVAQTRRRGLKLFLEQLLRRSDPVTKESAIASLTLLPEELAMDLLRNLLAEDKNESVKHTAITALATIATPAAQTMLLKMLLSEDELTSAHVAEHLAWQGGEGWDALRDAATDEDPEVRRAANYGLALVDEPWAAELLNGLEEDREWIVRAAANSVVEMITRQGGPAGWQPVRLGDQPWLIQWAASQGRAVPSGIAAVPIIMDLLENGNEEEIRSAAARTLGEFALADARRSLQYIIQNEDARLRDAAYNALSLINRAY